MRLRRTVATAITLALAAPTAALGTAVGLAAPAGGATSTDLFFSEYIEGTGFNAIDLGIPVRGDHQRERDETFGVVALASGGVRHEDPLATATIVNDD